MRRATNRPCEIRSHVPPFQSTLSMRRATNRPCEIRSHVPPFQSTLSMRRATHHAPSDRPTAPISIHALHEESDPSMRRACWRLRISIHALHEESDTCATWLMIIGEFQSTLSMRRATISQSKVIPSLEFQSTLSMRRATYSTSYVRDNAAISIHALHEESDLSQRSTRPAHSDFNPRSP